MDISKLVSRVLGGEEYSKVVAELPDENRTEFALAVRKASDTAATEELGKVNGLREEKRRLEEKNKGSEKSFTEKFQAEQIDIAKRKLYSDPKFPLNDQQKADFESQLTKFPPQSVTAELIFNEMKKVYAYVNSDTLLDTSEKAKTFQEEADKFKSQMAGGSGGGNITPPDPEKYSKDAIQLHKDWQKQGHANKTIEQAQAIVVRGENWRARDLS